MTSTLLAMLPIVILYLFAQKYIVQGMVDGSIKLLHIVSRRAGNPACRFTPRIDGWSEIL